MSSPPRILIVEDEPALAVGIQEVLAHEGYSVDVATDGATGFEAARAGDYELVILDVMLPGKDGYTVCRELREHGSRVPVLFLTAKGDPADRIRGLEEGGDDYMSKPFHLKELLLRVSAILRRQRWYSGPMRDSVLRFGGNEVDFRTYQGRSADGTSHELTHKEAMILRLLAEREGEVVSRDDVLDVVWGNDVFPSSRTVDNFILRLRRRFERDPQEPRHFHTVHGVGYRFTAENAPS